MGPPPFGDGKIAEILPKASPMPSFNGATAFRRWKAPMMGTRLASCWRLQWGHRLSAMESVTRATPRFTHDAASMGPPPFGDGKCGLLRRSCG